MVDQAAQSEAAGSGTTLYTLGGAAAWIVVVVTVVEVIGFMIYPQPGTVRDWFLLFQSSRLIGLMDFWGLEIVMYAMFTLVFLALYIALRGANQSLMIVATAFALLGIGVFFATNNPFTMLSLSNQYAAAVTDAQRAAFLAAGETVLANTGQRAVGGFNTGLFLVSVGGLIVSAVMLKGSSFSRFTAYAGIAAFGLSLADYLRQALTQSAVIALLLILPNALFVVIWFVLVSRRLLQLGRGAREALPQSP